MAIIVLNYNMNSWSSQLPGYLHPIILLWDFDQRRKAWLHWYSLPRFTRSVGRIHLNPTSYWSITCSLLTSYWNITCSLLKYSSTDRLTYLKILWEPALVARAIWWSWQWCWQLISLAQLLRIFCNNCFSFRKSKAFALLYLYFSLKSKSQGSCPVGNLLLL